MAPASGTSEARPYGATEVAAALSWWRGHRWARYAVIAMVILIAAAAWGYAWAAKHVTVIVDGEVVPCFSLRLTVGGVLADAGITVGAADRVAPAPDERIVDGGIITIRRAFGVLISADDTTTELTTAAATVGEALATAGISLGEHDRAEPSPESELVPGIKVRVVRVVIQPATEHWTIARKVTRREVDSLQKGVTRVAQEGKDGVEEVTFIATYEDGVEVGRMMATREVIAQPVNRVVHVGTAGSAVREGETIAYRRAMSMVATAYYWGPECTGKWADGYTYTGLKAEKGVIAVDPKVIPLGTKVYIDGYGFAIAADIGGAIKGNRIDLCFDTLAEVHQWGMRRVTLYWLW